MKSFLKSAHLLFLLPLALLLCLIFIYRGSGTPLSSQEVDRYIGEIKDQTQEPGGRHGLGALRSFLANDDGNPFYTVNLYKYYDRARYLDGRSDGGSGREAYDRFSSVMVGLLAGQASHPIFASNWIEDGNHSWDRLVIVRYRSRRDIA